MKAEFPKRKPVFNDKWHGLYVSFGAEFIPCEKVYGVDFAKNRDKSVKIKRAGQDTLWLVDDE